MIVTCGISKRTRWEEDNFDKSFTEIEEFKCNVVSSFGAEPKSFIRIVKLHAMDQIFEYIIRNGSLFITGSGLYEYAQNIFKREYRKTSKRWASVLEDSILYVEKCTESTEVVVQSISRKLQMMNTYMSERDYLKAMGYEAHNIFLRLLKEVLQ